LDAQIVACPVTVNKQQLFKPFQLIPSVTAIYLLKGWQGSPGAIKLFASSAFKKCFAFCQTVICGLWLTFLLREGLGRRKGRSSFSLLPTKSWPSIRVQLSLTPSKK
jgi:hypothetical protein